MAQPDIVLILVLLAALLHAVWNALIKSSEDSTLTTIALFLTGSAICTLTLPFADVPARESWPFLAAGIVLHSGYVLFLMLAYRLGDLSHVYPLARGTAPLLVALASGPIIGERLASTELAGVGLVSAGIASLALDRSLATREGRAGALWAAGTGLWIAGYTVVDGMGVRRAGGALSYLLWLQALEVVPLAIGVFAVRGREVLAFLRSPRARRGALGGVLAVAGYSLVLWAYSLGAIAPVAALRETSTILAALIGTLLLGEPFGRRRLLAAALVAAGAVVLNL